ncbi:MAG: HEAT repeat domain-containing protein [Tildeniella nuda ZEHNDER 1965/U140]|jgi:hypothetical protein|nr:HEAT repeat domain-containing protein [Tildeniella nuda ZEHNDER 1965/U140]
MLEIADLQFTITMHYHPNNEVRNNAAYALGDFGGRARDAVQPLIEILKDQIQTKDVRSGAAYALGKIDGHNKEIITVLRNTLKDENIDVRIKSAASLENVAKTLYDDAQTIHQVDAALATTQELVKDLEIPEFEQHQKSIKRIVSNLTNKKNIIQAQARLEWVAVGRRIWLHHALFWLILVFVYPKSSQIQAIFFWNPWIRNILGLGYVTFLLQWVPFLRRKLFEPFKPSLLADAGLDSFKPDLYFSDSEVCLKGTDSNEAITAVCPGIQGQRIIEGDSGLGKTMFLRHLLQQSKRIVVYLPATKCAEGVIEAIQKKLHGDEIKDTKFLQSLIYSGAIDICIDGLNEVNPDTRAKITQFVESHFKGNILMTTQPLEWLPPSTAKTYVMQPLQLEQIERYLLSRQPSLPKAAPVQGTAYEQACRTFLSTMLSAPTEPPPSPQLWGNQTVQSPPELGDLGGAKERNTANLSSLSPEELKTARAILSNPMELTLAAWMLAGGVQPDLFNLREQQYKLMAEEYRRTWNQDFPLKHFSEAVYQQWLLDQKALPADKFYNELLCMEDEKFRMVVSRQWKDAKGEAKKEWYFRHDKIAEFFLVQTFLGKSEAIEERLKTHVSDSRFRGVYFLLATLLPLDAAQRLREDLIQYAADTKDHTVSDTFVQLLRSR